MLKPSMNELMAKVSSRYLLVNLAAQRARDISDEAERTGGKLPDKSVKLALDEIAEGTVVYRDGPKPEPEPQPEPEIETEVAPELLDLDGEDEDAGEDEEAFALSPEPDIIYSGRSEGTQEF